jgi:hypothetical protein
MNTTGLTAVMMSLSYCSCKAAYSLSYWNCTAWDRTPRKNCILLTGNCDYWFSTRRICKRSSTTGPQRAIFLLCGCCSFQCWNHLSALLEFVLCGKEAGRPILICTLKSSDITVVCITIRYQVTYIGGKPSALHLTLPMITINCSRPGQLFQPSCISHIIELQAENISMASSWITRNLKKVNVASII